MCIYGGPTTTLQCTAMLCRKAQQHQCRNQIKAMRSTPHQCKEALQAKASQSKSKQAKASQGKPSQVKIEFMPSHFSIEFGYSFDSVSLQFRQNSDRVSIESRLNFDGCSMDFHRSLTRISIEIRKRFDRISIECLQNFFLNGEFGIAASLVCWPAILNR